MKKIFRKTLQLLLLILLIACNDASKSTSTSKAPSATVSSTVSLNQTTPISRITNTPAWNDYYVPQLIGGLLVNSSSSGKSLYLSLREKNITPLIMPPLCKILEQENIAICEDNVGGLFLYEFASNGRTSLALPGIQTWSITSAENKIFYYTDGLSATPNAFEFDLNLFQNNEIGYIDLGNWLLPPTLSNDGKYLVGVQYSGAMNNLLYLIETQTDIVNEIGIQGYGWPTYNTAWSPVTNEVAIGITNIKTEIGTCVNKIGVYIPQENILRVISSLPDGNCYDDFGAHRANIWSPDGRKIALGVNHEKICVITVLSKKEKCFTLNEKRRVYNLVWSPDSNHLAFITSDFELKLLLLEGEESVNILDLSNVGFSPDYLAWVENLTIR